jgi:hypothetical protein
LTLTFHRSDVKVATVFLLLFAFGAGPVQQTTFATQAEDPIPLMAYYYIWYDVPSWDRAKSDYPVLGRYSSDNAEVMEQHVLWAKEAGIDGFIVSWKSTFQLDSRLETLMDIAAENDFNLWIIYQGLDFDRNPLPIEQIDSDFGYFLEKYADHPAFEMYDKPLVIWSGTWEFSREEIEDVTQNYRDRLYILASERDADEYLRMADLVDGNAYYWSSVDPYRNTNYQNRLDDMSRVVHEYGGFWIAPAAPGFDARLIGGTRVIERNDGETLRLELNAALRSSPDAIGLISWNEFSENSHVEPSEEYGYTALDVLSGREQASAPVIIDFDSSAPGTTDRDSRYPFYVLGVVGILVVVSLTIIIGRQLFTA